MDHNPTDLKREIERKWEILGHERPETLKAEYPSQPSIYRVPEHLRELSNNAYIPWRVSIGPYHYNNPKFWVMEEHKLEYMKAFINRASHKKLEDYIKVVEQLEPMARFCYADRTIGLIQSKDFVEMLLIDGCFIVEFLLRKIQKLALVEMEPTRRSYGQMYEFVGSISPFRPTHDIIFRSTRTSFEVRRDLILLENQLPYDVLERLYDLTFNKPDEASSSYAHSQESNQLRERIGVSNVANLVSFLKICCRPFPTTYPPDVALPVPTEPACLCSLDGRDTKEFRVPSVTQLAKAGVHFKASKSPWLSIDFANGVLELPALSIWHHTDTFFRNVMVYELYTEANHTRTTTISDYMCLMDDLINSKEDVALLTKEGIIHNWLESDDALSDLFNSITKHILADHASYARTCKDLNDFLKKPMPKYKAILRQNYFNEPWAIIYFITGVLIQTAATIIQAVTDIRSNK
ncbi:putative UPF0481 protein At3g02645 [Beta vulgaris subsp. vulgaris]|uniref:putative UPF0481 protein At3g02645 n=1 Tax=Beta vulgaris subsp. vulgaris TaxID=3555 RepID=UPI002036753A|nr:putative UPF0481 protein At3g02645 [Beta vulgaris subsp. vulgaris]